jgi:hypothetical protein
MRKGERDKLFDLKTGSAHAERVDAKDDLKTLPVPEVEKKLGSSPGDPAPRRRCDD